MKKFIYMAVAAMVAFSSCSKDNDPTIVSENGNQALTFTASMENGVTRATYDGDSKCASWVVGDQISVNGTIYTAQETGTTTTFKSSDSAPSGSTYKAYFPASLYNEGNPALPAELTLSADKFDMPMYDTTSSTNLEFKNLCAVLAVKVTSDDIATLKSIKVKADQKLNGKFTVEDDKAVIGTEADNGTKELVLTRAEALTLDADGATFYIPVPAQTYQYLNIYLSADGSTYKEVMSTRKAPGIGELARNKMFSIDYAKNAVQLWADGPYFAMVNIGATLPEQYGDYFAWGETEPYYTDGHAYDSPCSNWKSGKTGYDWATYKYGSSNTALTKYNKESSRGDVDNKTVLDPEDDAATANWGGSWRMPTKAEIEGLANSSNCTSAWTDDYNSTGKKGRIFTGVGDYADISLFLPAAGYRYDADLKKAGSEGYYYSSSLYEHGSCNASILNFGSGSVSTSSSSRYCGQSVRAVCP